MWTLPLCCGDIKRETTARMEIAQRCPLAMATYGCQNFQGLSDRPSAWGPASQSSDVLGEFCSLKPEELARDLVV